MPDEPNPRAEVQRGEGGEWQLLLARLSSWIEATNPEQLWIGSQRPLRLLALLITALVVLKVYGALLDTIASVPLMGGLLELVGLIWLTRFISGHLLRAGDRDQTLSALVERWRRFRGGA